MKGTTMNSEADIWLYVAGLCGLLAIVSASLFVAAAILGTRRERDYREVTRLRGEMRRQLLEGFRVDEVSRNLRTPVVIVANEERLLRTQG